jgi:hypothetical protein
MNGPASFISPCNADPSTPFLSYCFMTVMFRDRYKEA